MTKLIGNLIFIQSGGPTSVFNASAAGVFISARKNKKYIKNIYAANFGLKGFLNEDIINISKEDLTTLKKMKYSPSSLVGSSRFKLGEYGNDRETYDKILEIIKKYNIRYIMYNGGNDSMDSALKLTKFLQSINYDCNIIGVPKTIDNDLVLTDHTPGFSSCAKYVISSIYELIYDINAYDVKQVNVVEIMGRNAGWLTASTIYLKKLNFKPDIILLPETPFSYDKFLQYVKKLLEKKNSVLIAMSEGVKNLDGKYLFENNSKDAFGHMQLGGAAKYLSNKLTNDLNIKSRAIELNLLQRCAAHLASQTDINESYLAGFNAVKYAVNGETGKMVGFKRLSNKPYKIKYELYDLNKIANFEKKLPLHWIIKDKYDIVDDMIDYIEPLIKGKTKLKYKNSLQDFAVLNKYKVIL